jgi:hypothetical protein
MTVFLDGNQALKFPLEIKFDEVGPGGESKSVLGWFPVKR